MCRDWVNYVIAVALHVLLSGVALPADGPTERLWATGFSPAEAVAFDHDGTAYVSNYRRMGTIGSILPDGTASIWCDLNEIEAGQSEARPTSIAVDTEGRLVVADAGSGRLLRIDRKKKITVLVDRFDGLEFEQIQAVALRSRLGQLAGADIAFSATTKRTGQESQTSLFALDLRTSTVRKLPLELTAPVNATFSPNGKILVVIESNQNKVWTYDWDQQGEFQLLTKLGGNGNPLAAKPLGICPSNQLGSVLVAIGHRQEVIELHLESGQTLRTIPFPGQQGVACAVFGKNLFVVVQEKEAVFRLPLSQ
jgi:sugar lactone lactonase YvrE